MHYNSSSFLTPTLGFASNLSHTIIREAHEDDDRSIHSNESSSTTISITDEELALLGAPWAKEGMLCRKQYWESTGRRARDRAWLDVFVVIQRGELNMFTFGERSSSGSGGTFGGGNWLVSFQLDKTINSNTVLLGQCPRCWDCTSGTFVGTRVTSTWIQQTTTILHGFNHGQWSCVFFPGRN